jgi:hypothetical protein
MELFLSKSFEFTGIIDNRKVNNRYDKTKIKNPKIILKSDE